MLDGKSLMAKVGRKIVENVLVFFVRVGASVKHCNAFNVCLTPAKGADVVRYKIPQVISYGLPKKRDCLLPCSSALKIGDSSVLEVRIERETYVFHSDSSQLTLRTRSVVSFIKWGVKSVELKCIQKGDHSLGSTFGVFGLNTPTPRVSTHVQ